MDLFDFWKDICTTWFAENECYIIKYAGIIFDYMTLLKYKLKRNTINQIYISYLRPILEYGSILWDNCIQYEKDMLERIQYEAARLVTGLTRSVTINNLLNEIGWVSLSDRSKIQKLILMYKNNEGILPQYLIDEMPQLVSNNTSYNLRNSNDLETLVRRTEMYSNSTIPSAARLWNDLNPEIKYSETLTGFKSKLKKMYKPPIVPNFFTHGERSMQIHHTRIETNVATLMQIVLTILYVQIHSANAATTTKMLSITFLTVLYTKMQE